MEELWTPWRMQYILRSHASDACIFCQRQDPGARDPLVLHRGSTNFVLMNLYPYVVGHLMVIPYRHLSRLHALSTEEREEMAWLLRHAESILRRTLGARRFHVGINLGRAAGAGVDGHLHTHVVPRRDLPQDRMPSAVLPEPIEETVALLRPQFAALR